MIAKLLFALTLIIIQVGCNDSRHTSFSTNGNETMEIWSDTPSAKTTKIKVVTNLSGESLKDYYVQRVLRAKYIIDTANIRKNYLPTIPKKIEVYYVQLFVEFKDSIAIFYGRHGIPGINAYATGNGSSGSGMNWQKMEYKGRAWPELELVSWNPDNSKTLYNNK